jgi:flagellar FliJ protein
MKHSTDWRRLQDLAEGRRDRCAQRLAEARTSCDTARRKLEMLVDYRRDYDTRLARSAHEGIDAAKLRGYRTFLANLEQAIGQQSELVGAAEQKLARAEEAWRAEQRSVDSFRVLDGRRMSALAQEADRREQKLLDEMASRAPTPRGSDD